MPMPMPTRKAQLAAIVLACASLLGGCSVWRSVVDPLPAPAKAGPLAEPGVCTDCVASSVTAAASTPAPAVAPVAEKQPAVSTAPVAVAATSEVRPLEAAAPQAVAQVAQSALVPAATPTKKAVELQHGYYINVGLFAVPANGAGAQQKLKKLGLPVYSELVEAKNGPVTRVRVGPYAKRSQADAAAKKVRAAKLDAFVFKR